MSSGGLWAVTVAPVCSILNPAPAPAKHTSHTSPHTPQAVEDESHRKDLNLTFQGARDHADKSLQVRECTRFTMSRVKGGNINRI